MAVSTTQLRDGIKTALINVGREWAEHQCRILDGLATSQTKLLGLPAAFQAAAWLNTGLGATRTLFPNTAVAGAVARLSVPIAIVNYAMEAFQALHKSESDRITALMKHDYTVLKESLQKKISDAARDLLNTPFGRATCEVMFKVVSRRLNEFDEYMVYSHCANVIQHPDYGVIETDVSKIRQRTEEGFLALCNKIYDIYRGSHGSNTLMHVDSNKEVCYQRLAADGSGLVPVKKTDPFTNRRAVCGPEFDLLAQGNFKRRDEVLRLLTDVGRYDTLRLDGWIEDHVYVRPSQAPVTVDGLASNYAKNGITDFQTNIEKADQAEWPRSLRVRSGGVAAY